LSFPSLKLFQYG